jgi:hypothetical protein
MNLNFTIREEGDNLCRNTCAPRLSRGGLVPKGAQDMNPVLLTIVDPFTIENNHWEYVARRSTKANAWQYQMRSGLNHDLTHGYPTSRWRTV